MHVTSTVSAWCCSGHSPPSQTKFLKNGSFFDLLSTTTTNNVLPMTHVGLDNFDLVKYRLAGDAQR